MRPITPLALSACALAALSACTSTGRPAPGAPSAPPAAAGAPTAGASAGATPAAPKPSSATPKPARPAAKPVAARPSWRSVDFAEAAYGDLGRCVRTPELPDTAEISGVRYADLTGDGLDEAIVAAACRTTTASNPISVLVYDGADRRAPLRRLGAVGTSQYLVSAKVTTRGRTLTVTSRALGDRAPRCCPDLRITQTYEWRDGELRRVAIDEAPLPRD